VVGVLVLAVFVFVSTILVGESFLLRGKEDDVSIPNIILLKLSQNLIGCQTLGPVSRMH